MNMNMSPEPGRIGKQIFNTKLALVLSAGLIFAIGAGVQAQAQTVDPEGSRKVKVATPPEYPALARQNGIRGIARVLVTIQPDGTVSEVKEVGGNPVLLDALSRAVKKWKYEKSEKVSVLEVKAGFGT
jgi:TonB family protein